MFDYDAELRRYNEHFRAATAIEPRDRVLDIGCGAGQSTRDAARAAVAGSALGVDVSARTLEIARERAVAEGLTNVTFEEADAQQHPFADQHFDVAMSRFGTMFFAEPVRAFTNIARALRPGARLVMLVWQDSDRQEWTDALQLAALASGRAQRAPGAGGAFSLADPATVDGILGAAGFSAISRTDLHEPVFYGPDAASAYDSVLELYKTADVLPEDPERSRAREQLRAALAAHDTGDGVWFDSRVWLITARR